jgi:uncharacterized protein (DUF39 family)
MDSRFIRGARFHRYGVSLYVGVGIPIPVLDEEMAAYTGVADSDIFTSIFDYSQPTRAREPLGAVSYSELRSGSIEIAGKKVISAPLSSYKVARSIAEELKAWIKAGEFALSRPVEPLPSEGTFKPLEIRDGEGI